MGNCACTREEEIPLPKQIDALEDENSKLLRFLTLTALANKEPGLAVKLMNIKRLVHDYQTTQAKYRDYLKRRLCDQYAPEGREFLQAMTRHLAELVQARNVLYKEAAISHGVNAFFGTLDVDRVLSKLAESYSLGKEYASLSSQYKTWINRKGVLDDLVLKVARRSLTQQQLAFLRRIAEVTTYTYSHTAVNYSKLQAYQSLNRSKSRLQGSTDISTRTTVR